MNALLVTLLLAVAPAVPPMPTTVEQSCDMVPLAPFLAASAHEAAPAIGNIDRRIQIVLAAEREVEATLKDRPPESAGRGRLAAGAALILVAIAAGVAASRRRSLALVGVAWGVAAVGGVLLWRQADDRAASVAQRADLVSRQLQLTQCRLQLNETRGQIQHALLAEVFHDLGEVDEDLASWEAKVRGGTPVTPEDLAKLRGEIQAALKP